MIYSLGLPIGLWVTSKTEVQLGIHGFVQSFPKLQNKFGSSIRHNPLKYSLQTGYPRHIQLCWLRSGVGHFDEHEVSYLG
jgi:hypothetical protein